MIYKARWEGRVEEEERGRVVHVLNSLHKRNALKNYGAFTEVRGRYVGELEHAQHGTGSQHR
jgi:hypothetical protein